MKFKVKRFDDGDWVIGKPWKEGDTGEYIHLTTGDEEIAVKPTLTPNTESHYYAGRLFEVLYTAEMATRGLIDLLGVMNDERIPLADIHLFIISAIDFKNKIVDMQDEHFKLINAEREKQQ